MLCNSTSFNRTILQDQNGAFQSISLTKRERKDILDILKWERNFHYAWEWSVSICHKVNTGIINRANYIIKYHQSDYMATLWDYDRRVPYNDEFQRLDTANLEIWQKLSEHGIKIVVPIYTTNNLLISRFIRGSTPRIDQEFKEKRKNCKNIINTFLEKHKSRKKTLWEDIYFDDKIDNYIISYWIIYLVDPFMWNGNWCE